MSSRYYLDADTTPTVRSRHAYTGLEQTISFAMDLVGRCQEGQIGVYKTHLGDGFKGYAINDGSRVYFEPALAQYAEDRG